VHCSRLRNLFEARRPTGGIPYRGDPINAVCPPNGFRASLPGGLRVISLVRKVSAANGRPAVKLSDNPKKATGTPEETAQDLRVFRSEGRVEQDVVV
jgi:hypothetical protein